jgi:hypothetical protein
MTHDAKDPLPHAGDASVPTAESGEAVSHLGQDDADDAARGDKEHEKEQGSDAKPPPRQPGGIASGLQPGGTSPGGGPGASAGSIGTGGAQTGGGASGSVKKSGI